MSSPIDPRPLPAAWLRVWRSLGLDVSGLEHHPEPPAEQRADLEILTPDEVATTLRVSPSKNRHPRTRTP